MILTALARLGRDVELRYMQNGDPVANLALAINYGKKGDDGNKPTQWVDAAFYGKRAEAMAPHLTKGTMLYIVVEEPHIETYQGKNGQGAKLVGRIVRLDFAGGKSDGQQDGQQRQQSAPKRQEPPRQPAPKSGGGFGDMDDDMIPF